MMTNHRSQVGPCFQSGVTAPAQHAHMLQARTADLSLHPLEGLRVTSCRWCWCPCDAGTADDAVVSLTHMAAESVIVAGFAASLEALPLDADSRDSSLDKMAVETVILLPLAA